MTAVMSRGSRADDAPDMTPRRNPGHAAGPFAGLRAEHTRALDALRKLECTLGDTSHRGRDERPVHAVVGYLVGPLRVHLAVEERVVFPALIKNLPELALTLESLRKEHAVIRDISESLGELLARPGTPRRDEQLLVQGRDLADLIRLHLRKEERAALDWSERVLPSTVQLEFGRRIARALAPVPPDDVRRP
jgi:hemerythrin-like domain-containing protein